MQKRHSFAYFLVKWLIKGLFEYLDKEMGEKPEITNEFIKILKEHGFDIIEHKN